MSDKVVYVCGVPAGGTSCVAGILHHLGVDMGETSASRRPYETFEDSRGPQYERVVQLHEVVRWVAGDRGGRRFRAYLHMRLQEADGKPCGVKLGAAYWLGDPEPASLPIRILKVNRPLETSIWSDLQYQSVNEVRDHEYAIRRAMQIAGYYSAKEHLCSYIKPTLTLEFYDVLEMPMDAVVAISSAFGLTPTNEQERAACAFVDPDLRNF